MLKVLLVGAAVLIIAVVALVTVISTRPSEFRVSRSTTISAPPSVVFGQVNDFHEWEAWNPWGKLDPDMTTTYEGPEQGPGATYSWTGDTNVGEGRMTIEESQPNERIRITLEFLKPMKAINTAEFTFQPEGNRTNVTWSMHGENNFMGKAVGLFMDMDKMIGDNFEKGLADLKAIAESKAGATA